MDVSMYSDFKPACSTIFSVVETDEHPKVKPSQARKQGRKYRQKNVLLFLILTLDTNKRFRVNFQYCEPIRILLTSQKLYGVLPTSLEGSKFSLYAKATWTELTCLQGSISRLACPCLSAAYFQAAGRNQPPPQLNRQTQLQIYRLWTACFPAKSADLELATT